MPIEKPQNLEYTPLLTKAGLDPDQAAVYELLLKAGELPARKIYKNTPYKRGHVYKILEELEELGLVVRHDAPKRISTFEPQHPVRLQELVEEKQKQAESAKAALQSVMDQITSDFNLVSGKSGVQVYEGVEGADKVALDSLSAKDEIYSYIDNEMLNKYLPKQNLEYISKRKKLGIKKKMLTLDSDYIKKRTKTFDPAVTEIRVIPGKFLFATVTQIYNDKVSYITLDPKKTIAIIIQDPHIAQMHKTLFEYTWSTAKPLASPVKGRTRLA